MRGGSFIKGGLVASLGAAALAGGTALAGSGVGGIFNLGVTNTVDNATTRLTGTHTSSMLDVSNTNTSSLNANGIVGRSASPTASGLAGRNDAGGIGLKGTATGGGSGLYGQSDTGLGVRAIAAGAGPAFRATNTGTGTAGAFEAGAGAAPFTVNSSTKVTNLNADLLDGFDANGLVRTARGSSHTLDAAVSFVERTTVSLSAPGPGFVLLVGTISVNSLVGGDTTCNPCDAFIRLRDTTADVASEVAVATFGDGATERGTELAQTWVFPVSAGPVSFALEATTTGGTPENQKFFDNPTLTALFVPFGSNGGGTLGVQATQSGSTRTLP